MDGEGERKGDLAVAALEDEVRLAAAAGEGGRFLGRCECQTLVCVLPLAFVSMSLCRSSWYPSEATGPRFSTEGQGQQTYETAHSDPIAMYLVTRRALDLEGVEVWALFRVDRP